MYYIKIKNFCLLKDISARLKRQATDLEKISVKAVSNNSKSKLYKELQISKNKMTKTQLEKWAKDLNKHFTKEDTERVKKHMERCSTPETM